MKSTTNGKNQKGYDLYNELIENWGYAYYDENEGKNYYHPTSYEQVKVAEEIISEIDKLAVDDPELLDLVENVRSITNNATKRKFVGSKWIIILSGIAVFFLIFVWMDDFSQKISGYYPPERAEEIYKTELNRLENQLQYYSLSEEDTNVSRYRGDEETRAKRFTSYQESLEEHKDLSSESYRKLKNSKLRLGAIQNLISSLIWLGIFIAYIFTSRAPIFLINRRQKMIEFKKRSSSKTSRMIFSSIGAILSAPTTITVTKYNDGSVKKEDNFLTEMGIRIIMIIVLAFLIIGLAFYMLPFLVIISYIRNYQYQKVDNIISWIRRKLGIKGKTPPHRHDDLKAEIHPYKSEFPLVDDIEVGKFYFVNYSEDQYLYFAKIIDIKDDSYVIQYFDGKIEEVNLDKICDYKYAIENLIAECNWENRGTFYPCKITRGEADQYTVIYDEDNVVEEVSIEQLRFC